MFSFGLFTFEVMNRVDSTKFASVSEPFLLVIMLLLTAYQSWRILTY
jgi:hypothetical protein